MCILAIRPHSALGIEILDAVNCITVLLMIHVLICQSPSEKLTKF